MGEAKRRKEATSQSDVLIVEWPDAENFLKKYKIAAYFHCVGMRDRLTEEEACKSAKVWRSAVAQRVECMMIHIYGYDDDSRELWEIPEVCSYLKHFVNYSGLSIEEASKLLPNERGCGLLAACGAFGEHYRRAAMATY